MLAELREQAEAGHGGSGEDDGVLPRDVLAELLGHQAVELRLVLQSGQAVRALALLQVDGDLRGQGSGPGPGPRGDGSRAPDLADEAGGGALAHPQAELPLLPLPQLPLGAGGDEDGVLVDQGLVEDLRGRARAEDLPSRGQRSRAYLRLRRPEGAAEGLLQRVQEGLDLVEALGAALRRPEGHDVEELEDLLEARLAHLQGDAAVAEEAGAPDAQHGLAALHAGGRHEAQERLDLLGRDGTPALVWTKTLLELLGVHVGLDHHGLDTVVRDKQLEEVQHGRSGRHLLSGT